MQLDFNISSWRKNKTMDIEKIYDELENLGMFADLLIVSGGNPTHNLENTTLFSVGSNILNSVKILRDFITARSLV